MKSPQYPQVEMRPVTLDEGLVAWECPQSGGHWISGDTYRAWLEKTGTAFPELPPEQGFDVQETPETARARICPETGRLMTKYKVGHGLSFTLDFSSATGGVWLDKDEWEALRSRNLHHAIHLIFTASWQRQRLDEQQQHELAAEFERRMGAEVYARAKEFKAWMRGQQGQRDILTYLQNPAV